MLAKGLGNRIHEIETTKFIRQHPTRVYIALTIIIASLITAPIGYSFWAASQQHTVQTLTFHLMSQDTSWINGTGFISFEDGSVEILTPWPAMPQDDSDDGSQIGWESWMRVERTFQEPEECRFEYTCVGMNMTVGPFIFMSNQALILYQDSHGRVIESWYGYLGS